jgi:hypothetical protein
MNGNCICDRLTDGLRNGEETKSPLRLAGWGLKTNCTCDRQLYTVKLLYYWPALGPKKLAGLEVWPVL